MQASEQTGGIFDVTCAPLINLWGFGFTKFDSITPQLVDSIRHFVGFRKVRLQGNRVMKDDPRILLNFSVLGGGTICNIIACLFDRKGISNYMIDIGGEMIAKGKNPQGWNWCIGIVRPKDDSTGTNYPALFSRNKKPWKATPAHSPVLPSILSDKFRMLLLPYRCSDRHLPKW